MGRIGGGENLEGLIYYKDNIRIMVFVWLALAIGVTLIAALVDATMQEMKEEFEEDAGFSEHAQAEKRAEESAYARRKAR